MKAEEWVAKTFKSRIEKSSNGEERILLEKLPNGSKMLIEVKRFADMFREQIEDSANGTNLKKANAIAQVNKGYGKFIEKCKEEKLF